MDAQRKGRLQTGTGLDLHRLDGQLNYSTLADARGQFLDAMRAAGIVPSDPDVIVGDGGMHRFHVEGDKSGSRNAWAILFLDGLPAGAYGTWKGDFKRNWHAGRGFTPKGQRERLAAEIAKAQRQRNAEQWAKWRDAQKRAQELWAQAAEPYAGHGYLLAKQVSAHGIRQRNKQLIVPMRDGDGELWSIQTITEDGAKRFLASGRKRGLYHAIGNVVDELLIAEGYATAASLHESTGKPVAVAFDCGNLEPVATVLRAKFPQARITLAADNDVHTEGNPGLTKATDAAKAIGGFVAIPPDGYNDFNDALTAVQA